MGDPIPLAGRDACTRHDDATPRGACADRA